MLLIKVRLDSHFYSHLKRSTVAPEYISVSQFSPSSLRELASQLAQPLEVPIPPNDPNRFLYRCLINAHLRNNLPLFDIYIFY